MSASTNILNITDDDDEVLSVIEEAEVLTQDFYGAARIPGIVVAMAILHFIGFLILAFYRKGKPTFPPKLNPLSAKDQERHFMAKYVLDFALLFFLSTFNLVD